MIEIEATTAFGFIDADRVRTAMWTSPADGAPAGGDWCEMFALGDDLLCLTIGDVCGHGIAAAGVMELVRAAVIAGMQTHRVPSDALHVANNVAHALGEGIVVTAIVAIFDQCAGTLTFANAGHPPPLMLCADGHAYLSQPSADLPLGIFPYHAAVDYVVELPASALVVIYTDGITEHNRDPIAGGAELVAAAQHVYRRTAQNDARAIARTVFQTGRGDDDAAALTLRISPGAAMNEPLRAAPVLAG